jgi:hypothetical protein
MSYLRGVHREMDTDQDSAPEPDTADRLIDYARTLFANPVVDTDADATPAWVAKWNPANMGLPLSAYDPFRWHGKLEDDYPRREVPAAALFGVPIPSR